MGDPEGEGASIRPGLMGVGWRGAPASNGEGEEDSTSQGGVRIAPPDERDL